MKKIILLAFILVAAKFSLAQSYVFPNKTYGIVIHGGAGNIDSAKFDDAEKKAHLTILQQALDSAYAILENGGSSIDAVEKAVCIMENSPLFNAGKGAVLNENGIAELDASIMDGKTLNAGAIAGVHTIKNPIKAARAVMEKSKHVLLVATGAENFAQQQKLEMVNPDYFYIDKQMQLKKIQEQKEKSKGTVGAVALDKHGNLAAATSTGGMWGKMEGRIGDSPIIGAGNYANNKTCAISATGHGEFFIRKVVAYDIHALMDYKGYSLKQATEWVVENKLKTLGANGGVIAIDANGNISMVFNTKAMFRGYKNKSNCMVSIF